MQEIIEANCIGGSQVLVVERESWVRNQVTYVLQNAGYKVMGIVDSSSIPLLIDSRSASKIDFDLVILADISNSSDCIQVCQWLRCHHKLMPIMVVSKKEREIDLILNLEMGANVYLTKPISSRELTVRCRNLIRRYRGCWQQPPSLSR